MYYNELSETIDHLIQPGKGILAADESNSTIGKRFAAIQLDNTAENRRDYRLLLATTPELSEYISGVILYEETFGNQDQNGKTVPEIFLANDILPGIKVDKGLHLLPNTQDEQVTLGLDDLADRLAAFKTKGAKFAKWRNVYRITDCTPSMAAMKTGAENLARYAATCQAQGIVPIVEPEVLIDGDHTLDHCAEVCELVLHEVFCALFTHQVTLEHIILKPSMVTCGKSVKPFSTPEDIADYTLSVFHNTVLPAVPSINFLSGGQTPDQATENLNAINNCGYQPWNLSFSYGRALQEECIQVWQGKVANVAKAQTKLLHRARLNSLASLGEYQAAEALIEA